MIFFSPFPTKKERDKREGEFMLTIFYRMGVELQHGVFDG